MFEVHVPETADELGEALDAAKVAEQFADAVKKMARPRITADPAAATGWHLAPSGAITSIDAAACMDAAMSTGRLPELLPFISLKAEAARALPWVGEFTTKKEKAPSLKPLPGRE